LHRSTAMRMSPLVPAIFASIVW